jgi:hypothetical protein
MAEVWPASLPQVVLVDGFSQAIGDGRIRHKPDTGPAIVRRRSSAMPMLMPCAVDVDDDQWDDLVEFGEVTLIGWTLPFTFPDPAGGAALLVRFGEQLPSRVAGVPGMWKVSLGLEVLP